MIALGEEDLVVEPSQRLTATSVAPSHNGTAGTIRSNRQLLDRDNLDDDSIGHGLMVRRHLSPPASGSARRGRIDYRV